MKLFESFPILIKIFEKRLKMVDNDQKRAKEIERDRKSQFILTIFIKLNCFKLFIDIFNLLIEIWSKSIKNSNCPLLGIRFLSSDLNQTEIDVRIWMAWNPNRR